MAKVLVTGGAGFIGSNLTEALLKRGHLVRVLDNFSTGKRENLVFDKAYPFLEIIDGDICDLTICQKAMKDIEYVFHQAALPSVQRSVEDPLTTNSVNVEGTLNVLLAARDRGETGDLCVVLFGLWRYSYIAEERGDASQSPFALCIAKIYRRAILPALFPTLWP